MEANERIQIVKGGPSTTDLLAHIVELCKANASMAVAYVDLLSPESVEQAMRKLYPELPPPGQPAFKDNSALHSQAERIRNLVSECNELETELNRAKIRENNMNERHAETLSLKARAEKMLTEKTAQFEELKQHADALSRRVESLKAQLSDLRKDAGEMEAGMRSRIKEVIEANAALQGRLAAVSDGRDHDRDDVKDQVRELLQLLRDQFKDMEDQKSRDPYQDIAWCISKLDNTAAEVSKL